MSEFCSALKRDTIQAVKLGKKASGLIKQVIDMTKECAYLNSPFCVGDVIFKDGTTDFGGSKCWHFAKVIAINPIYPDLDDFVEDKPLEVEAVLKCISLSPSHVNAKTSYYAEKVPTDMDLHNENILLQARRNLNEEFHPEDKDVFKIYQVEFSDWEVAMLTGDNLQDRETMKDIQDEK